MREEWQALEYRDTDIIENSMNAGATYTFGPAKGAVPGETYQVFLMPSGITDTSPYVVTVDGTAPSTAGNGVGMLFNPTVVGFFYVKLTQDQPNFKILNASVSTRRIAIARID